VESPCTQSHKWSFINLWKVAGVVAGTTRAAKPV